MWYNFIDVPAYVSDEAILSRKAASYSEKLYIDGEFIPAAAYYANKIVTKPYKNDLELLFKQKEPFLLITNLWRLRDIPETKYETLGKDRDKVLIRKN